MAFTKGTMVIYTTDLDENDYDKAWLDEQTYYMTEDEEEPKEYFDDLDEQDKWEILYQVNDDWAWMVTEELRTSVDGIIIAVRDMGLWDGRFRGIAEISDNLADILSDTMATQAYYEWYIEEGDVKMLAIHHDGRNYTTYRVCKDWDALYDMLERDWDNQEEILAKHTESLVPYVNEVYGWDF